MSNSPVRAAIYLRQSLDATGDELAVQRQRDACRCIAGERGWTVVGEYKDNSISASITRKVRPDYDRLVADHGAGMFDALICYDLDRLTRQPRQLEDWIDAAAEHGLRLVTANGEADLSTDAGRLFARIKASVARAEIERKAARQRSAAAQRAERGRPPLGPRLTGYLSDGQLVEHEADIVREVFERFAAGDSLRSIAAWLAEGKVPTRRGGRWNPSTVSSILRNPRYAGRAVYDGAVTGAAGDWKAVVADELFDQVHALLRDPRRRSHHAGYHRRYLGSGLYMCGECGKAVVSFSGSRYRCPLGCLVRSGGPVDDFVSAVLRTRLALPDLANLLPSADAGAVRTLTDSMGVLRSRLGGFESDYDDGLIDGRRYRVATEKVHAEMMNVQTRLAALGVGAGPAGHVLRAADPTAAFDAAPLMLQRGVIDALARVRLHRAPRGSRTFRPETVGIEWKADLS